MLYFRFDCDKEDFKGAEHKSVLFGDDAMTMVDFQFEEGHVENYYLDRYNKIVEEIDDFDEFSEEYDKLKKEYIEDKWTLDGCSCFELSEDGIDFACRYGHITEREIVTFFEGEEVDTGHDGETVAKCDKIVWQGDSSKITDIFYDDDIENKVEEILNIIK
jgi:hypothetical protein